MLECFFRADGIKYVIEDGVGVSEGYPVGKAVNAGMPKNWFRGSDGMIHRIGEYPVGKAGIPEYLLYIDGREYVVKDGRAVMTLHSRIDKYIEDFARTVSGHD